MTAPITMTDLRSSWLGRIMAQARVRNLQTPLVWTTAATFDGVLEDKLRDLVTLAPSTWDAVVRDLVRVTRMMHTSAGSLDDIKATLARCYSRVRAARSPSASSHSGPRSAGAADRCPILAEYRPALLHVLDSTFVMVACVWDRKNLDDMPAAEHIVAYDLLDKPLQAAVCAIRSQVKLTCHLGLPTEAGGGGGGGGGGATFQDAVLFAANAKNLHPTEGQWKALYGDLLPDGNPRKLTLLRNAVRARRTPFTLTCLSRYLYKLGDSKAFDLCVEALVEWPRAVHANVSYVIMYLSCPASGKLSRCQAELCLHRLQRLAPACVFVQGLALELRLHSAEVQPAGNLSGAGDAAGRRPVRPRPFEPTDHKAINKALELYCHPDGPRSLVYREELGLLRLEKCNCVCSGECAYLTFQAHGTLQVPDKPTTCYAE